VLFLLIPAAWLAVLFFAWAICRLAALSDDTRTGTLHHRLAASDPAEHESASADGRDEQLPHEVKTGGYRAAG
jgi:hypothetical protein